MGIFDALNTSVAGLQAQSFALQNISGNIANAQTTGYKGIDTSFVDLVPDATTPDRQVAGGVTAYAQSTISSQGTISASTVGTYMAINGDGFFSVQQASGTVDNTPVFTGVTDYTRRGDFQVNANGNLVNGAGYYLMGVPVDSKTGNPIGNVPEVLQFQNNFIPAQATSTVTYGANLPTTPTTTASATASAGTFVASGGLSPSDFTTGYNPLVVGTPDYENATALGTAVNNNLSAPAAITTATQLVSASNTNSLAATPTGVMTVDGKTITFSTSQTTVTTDSSGNVTIGTGAGSTLTVGDVLSAIDGITGGSGSSVGTGATAGQLTINTGSAQDLAIAGTGTSLSAFGLTAGTTVRTAGTNVGTGIVTGNDSTVFQNESISGGAVTVYDAAGTPMNLELRWAKTGTDTWNLFYQTDSTASGTQPAWVNVGTNFTFSPSGALTSPADTDIALNNVTVDGQTLPSLSINVGTGGLTQYATTGGTATINGISQNGYAAGQLQSVAINNSGLVVGTFSNGQNIDLASVTLSHFNGTNYLKALDGGAYAATDLSGAAIAGASGTISGSSLEGSNTDIADEFTKLIVTQQAYSANTKVITTANTMVQDLLDVLR